MEEKIPRCEVQSVNIILAYFICKKLAVSSSSCSLFLFMFCGASLIFFPENSYCRKQFTVMQISLLSNADKSADADVYCSKLYNKKFIIYNKSCSNICD